MGEPAFAPKERRPAPSARPAILHPAVAEGLATTGEPLATPARQRLEARFGHDFANVRIHADDRAASAAARLGAHAFTVGRDIVFGAGRYRPDEGEGQRRLAHELTHVVQQSGAAVDGTRLEPVASAAEREADVIAAGAGAVRPSARPRGVTRDVGWARRGPIPDAYGLGYNDIFARAGASAMTAVRDLASLEDARMDVDVAAFDRLPSNRALDVLALEPHAGGTACAAWFPRLRNRAIALTDPYGPRSPVSAYYFPGRTTRKALIIGGVHNRTEPQGERVVEALRALLTSWAAANPPRLPHFTTVLVPTLFDRGRYSRGSPRWITGGVGRTTGGAVQGNRAVEPNRNYPLPGEGLETAHNRGTSSSTAPELLYQPSPSATPRPAQDTSRPGGGGTSNRMLPETRALIALIEHFKPERLASVHAHNLGSAQGNAPGIFADPRFDPAAGAAANATMADEDDRLAAAMVARGKAGIGSGFTGNHPGQRPRYSQGAAHAEGNSLGDWAPRPVTGSGARAGITTVTVEVPQPAPTIGSPPLPIETLHRDLLAEIFLGDPTTVTPSSGSTTTP